METTERRPNTSWTTLLLLYSALFLLCFALFSLGCLVFGKGFIWSVDGLEQQYSFFVMQGNWIRELITNIFVDHSFVIPMWTESVGYGADYIYSLGNTLGNPINWLSVFATPESADYWLNATVFITLYLAGLAFIGYCRYREFDTKSMLCGSIVYIFGGYSIIAFTQIYMVYPLVTAPLVLWGVDKVFDGKSPSLFIFGSFLCFFCSISLAYTTCLSLFVYCLVRVTYLSSFSVKTLFYWFIKVFSLICLAALLAAVMFLPNATALLAQGRLSLDRAQSLLYSPAYYISIFEGFISYSGVGDDCLYGFSSIAFMSVVSLFIPFKSKDDKRSKQILRVLFIIYSIFICLPIIGRIYNGMAYANNRWIWAYCLLVSVIVASELPRVRFLFATRSVPMILSCAIYGLIFIFLLQVYKSSVSAQSALLLLVFTLFSILFASNKAVFSWFVVGSIIISITVNSLNWGINHSGDQVDLGKSYDYEVTDNPVSLLGDLADSSFDRYDTTGCQSWRNGNIAAGLIGSTFYNSFYNGYVDDYHTSLGLVTSSMNFSFNTFNSRSTLEALAGTKYFIVGDSDASLLPPSFDKKISTGLIGDKSYSVYENSDSLPLAFCYSKWISREDYNQMDLLHRQDALTQGVILDSESADAGVENELSLENGDIRSYSKQLVSSFDLTPTYDTDHLEGDVQSQDEKSADVSIDGNAITVKKSNTTLYLNADIPAGQELYFVCQGMNYSAFPEDERPAVTGIRSLRNALNSTDIKDSKLFVTCDGKSQEIWFMNNKHHLYGGKDDWAMNVGVFNTERHSLAVTFTNPGVYSFDSFGLYAVDIANVERDVSFLNENGANEICRTKNGYSCSVDIPDNESYLYFRIPYSSGWCALVDDEPIDPVCANVGFMALRLNKGHHKVSLQYQTPYLGLGAFLSFVGVIVYCAFTIYLHTRQSFF